MSEVPTGSSAEPNPPTEAITGGTTSSAPVARPQVKRHSSRTPLYVGIVIVVVAVAGVGAAYEDHLFGGGTSKSSPCSTGETLYGEGGAFSGSLVDAWAAQYQSTDNNVVNYDPAGSGAGVTQLTDQLQDFASTDEPLNASETNALPGSVLTLPVAGGALSVIYNLPSGSVGTDQLKLSGPVLADIYLGKITMWNDPRIQDNNSATLPDLPIDVVYRTDAAGLTFVLTSLLTDDSPAWAAQTGAVLSMPTPTTSDKLGASGNSKMLSDVEDTSGAIGYSDLTDTVTAAQSEPQLQYAEVLNPAGNYVLPSPQTAGTAIEHISANTTFPASTGSWTGISMVNAGGVNDYPLSTLAYFLVYQHESTQLGYEPSEARDRVLQQWLLWTLSASGQGMANEYDFVGLSSSLIAIDEQGISSMTFGGTQLQSCSG